MPLQLGELVIRQRKLLSVDLVLRLGIDIVFFLLLVIAGFDGQVGQLPRVFALVERFQVVQRRQFPPYARGFGMLGLRMDVAVTQQILV